MSETNDIDPELLCKANIASLRENWKELERLIGLEFHPEVIENYLLDGEVGKHRVLLYASTYTMYHLVHGNLDALKPIWRSTVESIRQHAPDYEDSLRDSFEGTVACYHEMYNLCLKRSDYGF